MSAPTTTNTISGDKITKKCHGCGVEHQQPSQFCSQFCFDVWYEEEKLHTFMKTLALILNASIGAIDAKSR